MERRRLTRRGPRASASGSGTAGQGRPDATAGKQEHYSAAAFCKEAATLLATLAHCPSLDLARTSLLNYIAMCESYALAQETLGSERFPLRDCSRSLRWMVSAYADHRTGFSIAQALWDLAHGKARPELSAAFFAELTHLVRGLEQRESSTVMGDFRLEPALKGRRAARERSEHLDQLWSMALRWMERYDHGLKEEVIKRRAARQRRVMSALGAREADWHNWRWQIDHVITDERLLAKVLRLGRASSRAIAKAREAGIPFGLTPFYCGLMDDEGEQDRALRAQVLPSPYYVNELASHRNDRGCRFDFMGEVDTSPVALVTRRYPTICILKPYNTCPQICVYCQRNWEITRAMDPGALAPRSALEKALAWLAEHPAISEVLVTGGDPLVMDDPDLRWLLDRLAAIESIERIRIGSRTLVTLPMRITAELAHLLAGYREPGRRDVCVVTHVQHPYEINPEMVAAVERLRTRGISVYNQLVYTFFISRRFEAVMLRRMLKLIGIDPYYTFNTKGKEETTDYRVPIARLLQEQKEESRLAPGLVRTDEAVFNVPRLGKNHLRASQHRDLLTVLPDGARVYEFHPWEKRIVEQDFYSSEDVPILTYLQRLVEIGEDPEDYQSIWYYY